MLLDLAVQPRRQLERLRVRNLVGGHHPGTEAASPVEILAGRDLSRVALPVPDAAVEVARVTGNVVERRGRRNGAAARPDDHRQFAFEVEVVRHTRHQQRLTMSALRRGDPDEPGRVLGLRPAGFGDVIVVIEGHGKNLVRVRNDREKDDVCQGVVARLSVGGAAGFVERIGGNDIAQRLVPLGQPRPQVYDSLTRNDAKARVAVHAVRSDLHLRILLGLVRVSVDLLRPRCPTRRGRRCAHARAARSPSPVRRGFRRVGAHRALRHQWHSCDCGRKRHPRGLAES